jgi:hypothetical protein
MSTRSLSIMGVLLLAALPVAAQQRIEVKNEGDIRDKWMLKEGVPLVAPQYPPALAQRGDEVCVSIGYLLNADGALSDFTMVKAWNSASGSKEPQPGYWAAFAEAAGDALAQWRFQPRPQVSRPQPVFTVGTFVFGTKGQATAVRDRCKIPNLVAHLRDVRSAKALRTAAVLSRLDLRDDADPDHERRRQAQSMSQQP